MELSKEKKELIQKFIETYQKPVQMQVLALMEILQFQKLLMQKEVWDIYIKVFIKQLEGDLKVLQEENK